MGGTAYLVFHYDKRGFFESRLFALDLETGSEKWSYTVGHVGNEPVTDANGTVYWSSFEGNVYALDAGGSLIWTGPGTSSSIFVPCLLGNDRLVVPEIAGGARATWCLDRATERTLWRFEHGGHASVRCHGEHVLNSSIRPQEDAGSLSCLAAADGTPFWSVTHGGDEFVLGDRVIIFSEAAVRAYSLGQGRRLARVLFESGDGAPHVAPVSTAEMLYLCYDRHSPSGLEVIKAVEPAPSKRFLGGERLTLHERWKIRAPRVLCEAPIAVSGAVLAYLTHDGVVCAIDRATGASVAEVALKTPRNHTGGLCVAGSRLIAVHGRDVFCFSLDP